MNRKELNDFIREGLQMRDLKHPNVMELYGICWSADPSQANHRLPMIVLPYMELGDLKTYLRKNRPGLQKRGSDTEERLPPVVRGFFSITRLSLSCLTHISRRCPLCSW